MEPIKNGEPRTRCNPGLKKVIIRIESKLLESNHNNRDYGEFNPFKSIVYDEFKYEIDEIFKLIKRSNKITIYGDYDVDGVTSSVNANLALLSMGKKPRVVINERSNGNGLNKKMFNKFKDEKDDIDLLILVDHGTVKKTEKD